MVFKMSYRTDRNNNPAAFTVDIAKQARLIEGVDFTPGEAFPAPSHLVTARLLRDPVAVTIEVIDRIGYYTAGGRPRWDYIALPHFVWDLMTPDQKRRVIGFHYQNEGGDQMAHLFK
jgi:hypothetical protein